jgi:sec-independent protein translocase protein TatB
MNFIGIGPQELVVILIVALIFVGPQRLPKLAADLARMIRDVRKYTGGIAAEFNEAIKEFEKDTEPERSQWKEIGQGLDEASRVANTTAGELAASATASPKPPDAPNGAVPPPANGAAPEPVPASEERV